jgi:mono/diheme cytochrome c family protein/nitrate/TMAO reductase-like tetraheme cytochrome c subunit
MPLRAAGADPCTLTFPPSKDTAAFETNLRAFLNARCYVTLGWTHDPFVRDTGPYIQGDSYGTHPSVRVWYSPDVESWMKLPAAKRATTPVADNAIIVKEMFVPPASSYSVPPKTDDTEGWTVMVRDANGSLDGWYWSSYFRGDNPLGTHMSNTKYPSAGYGNYCVNCHASAAADVTYATMRNVEGTNIITYLNVIPSMDNPTSVRPDSHKLKAEQTPGGPLLSGAVFDLEILKILAPWWKESDKLTSRDFPGETWDHVMAMKGGPEQFLTSDQCIGCHDATGNLVPYPANMLYPASGSPTPAYNVSPYGEWRASLMGLAGRDPVFYAQISSELTVHKNAKLPTTIPNICFRCHGVMGQRQLDIDTAGKTPFDPEMVYAWSPSLAQPANWSPSLKPSERNVKYGALARDSVSCTVCHHISDKALGEPSTYTGKFNTTDPKTIIGPFTDPQPLPMDHSLGMKPMHTEYVKESKLCASCHTIELPVLDAQGKQVKTTFEQTTYFEWQNSVFQNERQPVSTKDAQTCQDCHMPSAFKLKNFKSQELQYRIANIEDNTYPYVDDRLPDKDITLQIRKPYVRHTLVGINLFVQEMFLQFSDRLGIRTTDPMLMFPDTTVKGLALAEQATIDLAQKETADVDVLSAKRVGNSLEVKVRVRNNAGHSFPSGVSFRRAFLDFEVLDASGRTMWASGATNRFGMITKGSGGPVLPTEFLKDGKYQDHYAVINDQSQVQIYEELMKNTEGKFTTSFLSLAEHVKTNRLLPRGWSPNGQHANETKPHGAAAKDPDYQKGCGCDTIIYRIPLTTVPGAVKVRAQLFYQTIPPYYLQQRFTDTYDASTKTVAENTQRLMDFVAKLNVGATRIQDWKLLIAETTRSVTD